MTLDQQTCQEEVQGEQGLQDSTEHTQQQGSPYQDGSEQSVATLLQQVLVLKNWQPHTAQTNEYSCKLLVVLDSRTAEM